MPRAVRFDEYGGLEVLHIEDVPEPTPGPGEVVVAVVATSINPGEAKIRDGSLDAVFPTTFPSGEGSDFAGRVQATGDGAHAWKTGDEVIGWTDDRGAHADFVVVPDANLTMKPPAVSWEQAGALFVAGATAYASAMAVNAQDGETVAVSAAAGGVGSVLVQLLRSRGVRVLGIAGEANAEWLRSVGVEPIRHGEGLGYRLRDAAPDGIDAFCDLYGGPYVELAVGLGIAPERINTIVDFPGAEKFGVKSVGGSDVASPGVLGELAEQIADGEITIPIAATYPLDRVRDAYEELAAGHTRGKIVLLT
ncbi:NADP-dependent oxidoreductase [Jatrophihabitans endophyticus]|uniref:NADP-dependent oxidoreductase n=1 Tax=Jatrophihabitans endophyticus TaxID=1206085 RepID=UPI001A08FA97|nr:NADP-dependent oxidoreductase [Jatrophihabitans endophyticus]MBE7189006.1 NADP-dependent oxidoreductase [Jatrophihabitans endophyticus]